MAKLAPTLLSVLALCAATAMPQTTGSVFAFAGVAQAANPMVELVSGGDVTGDGATPVVLHMVAFNPDGTAMNGASLKLSAQGGSVGRVSMVQPGLYAAEWTPPSVDATSDIQLTVKGKTPDKIAVTQSWAVTVQPTLDQQITVQANPAEITLGRDSNATLNITLSGGEGRSLDGSDLIVRANSGTIENVTHLGGGRFAASYKPPAKFFPHVALITVADKRNPNRTYGSLSIPLVGKANFPVVGQPNSSVMVRIDDREYGPVASDSNGRAQVPLEVRPGFVEARVLSVANGQKTEEALDLQVPPANRVTLFPSSAALASDPTLSMPVRALVNTPNGQPDTSARVRFSATAGTMSEAVHEGNGIYRADFTPPFGNQRTKATFTVEVDDLKSAQVQSQTIELIPARPGSVSVTPEPATLMKAAKGFQLLAKVQSTDGVGMAGRTLQFQANGARSNGSPLDLGSGDYRARFTTTGNGAVEVITTVATEGSDNPFRTVLMFPSRDRMPNDGLSSAMLTILSLDEYGYPVGNVPIALKVMGGSGSIPAQATTDASGMAQVHFTSGRKVGLARIAATAHGHTTMIPMLLAPDQIAAGYSLPASGTATRIAQYKAWRNIIQSARLEREGMMGAPIDGYGADNVIGDISTIATLAEPNQIAPGGTVVLRITAKDAAGRGVGGQTLQVMASPGQVSAVTDQGGGRYTASVTAPAGVTGQLKISVVAPKVGVASALELPITGGNWSGVGMANQQASPEPKKKKAKRERTDAAWLRAQGGLAIGSYHYRQEPSVLLGPLYDYPITFGGSATAPATAPGLALAAAADIPGLEDNLAARVRYRSVLYRVSLPEFSEPVADWLTNFEAVGLGKGTFEAGSATMYAGARLGLGMDDFLVFQQSGNADVRTLDYGPLIVPSLVVGPEFGFTVDDSVFGHAALNFGLANFSTYYRLNLDAQVGYAFTDDMYAFFGADVTRRSLAVFMVPNGETEAQQVGVIEDHANVFTLGMGWQL